LAVSRNVLPERSDGIHIVFENECTLPFTYEINGANERYLGVGDQHDHKYNYLHLERKLFDLSKVSNHAARYSGAPLDADYCPFTLHLYPSDKMAKAYSTNDPLIFSLAAAMIFIFTALVFYLYDICVEIRQNRVMQTAVHSSAIISSMFPSSVRDRLFPIPQKRTSWACHSSEFTGKGDLAMNDNEADTNLLDSPIAQLYPETTVLLADIAGFTAWSSARQPTHVFELLETLYAAVDKLAKQHGVFKVGTIGDCYVAVVGLPTPRKLHAVVMARFARDIRNKMQELTVQLDARLGQVRKIDTPTQYIAGNC
jgi:Adenylate and Guanylate cyclase catalytic domain